MRGEEAAGARDGGVIVLASYPDGFLLDWTGDGEEARMVTERAFKVIEALKAALGGLLGELETVEVTGSGGRFIVVLDEPLLRASLGRPHAQAGDTGAPANPGTTGSEAVT